MPAFPSPHGIASRHRRDTRRQIMINCNFVTYQIKPGGTGYVKGREYYENMKWSVDEIKNRKGKSVDIPE